jgi:hypothetical protein
MFESRDAVNNPAASTTDNTSSILTSFAFDSMKEMRPYPKPDFKAMSEKPNPVVETGPKAVGAVGDEGHGCALPSFPDLQFPGDADLNTATDTETGKSGEKSKCATPEMKEPGVSHENPNPRSSDELTQEALDRIETELRLYDLSPKDNSTYGELSRELNHAFVSGDLKDFTDVLNKTDDVKLREKLVNDLDERLQKLEMDLPGETEMNSFLGELNLYGEAPGRGPALVIDMNTTEAKTVEADVDRWKFNNDVTVSTMKPIADLDMNPADLFRTLSQGEIHSIARSNAPLASPLS